MKLVYKSFSFQEGDILFVAHCNREGDWEIEVKIETEDNTSGMTISDVECPFMLKAMVHTITDDQALACILDEDYDFVNNFSENQTLSIFDIHKELHKKEELRRERSENK